MSKKLPPVLSAATQLYAVLGDPVEHSLSPIFQNEAFRAAGIDACYVALRVSAKDLPEVAPALARTSLKGFNATIPHKEILLKLCDKLSPEAQLIGAVNTVVIKGGKMTGHNTDGRGFLESLENDAKFDARRKKICLLGAGGAARAIAASLTKVGVKQIVVCNRTAERARALVDDLGKKIPKAQLTSSSLRKSELSRAFEGADLVVQTTPVGLDGRGIIPIPWGVLPKQALVADIVYGPRPTPLLTEAKRRRLDTLDGLGMLIYQGALAFELWTGVKPDAARMRRSAEKALSEAANE